MNKCACIVERQLRSHITYFTLCSCNNYLQSLSLNLTTDFIRYIFVLFYNFSLKYFRKYTKLRNETYHNYLKFHEEIPGKSYQTKVSKFYFYRLYIFNYNVMSNLNFSLVLPSLGIKCDYGKYSIKT